MKGWSEAESKAAVEVYFKITAALADGQKVNKAAEYRKLADKFPRSHKSFELKMQNISAVLDEQGLLYCKGLKPRGNYQRLLKLLVLEHLADHPGSKRYSIHRVSS